MFIIMQYFMLNFTIQTVIRTCIHDTAFDILGATISLLKDSLTNRYFWLFCININENQNSQRKICPFLPLKLSK